MRSRLLKFLLLTPLGLAGVVIAVVWTSQWWLPALAPSLLSFVDAEVDTSRRLEDGRWRLEGLRYDREGRPELTLEYAELPHLWSYLWARFRADEWDTAQQIELGECVLSLDDAGSGSGGAEAGTSWTELFSRSNQQLEIVDQWLPPLSLSGLRIEKPSSHTVVELRSFRFQEKQLSTKFMLGRSEATGSARLALAPENWSLKVYLPHEGAFLEGRFGPAGQALQFEGALVHADGQIDMGAVLSGKTKMPSEVRLTTSGFSFPESWIPVPVAARLEQVRIESADILWADGAYAGDLDLGATTGFEGKPLPVKASLGLKGNLKELRLQHLEIQLPWLKASLQKTLAVDLKDMSIPESADFTFTANLSRQSYVDLSGTLRGTLSAKYPDAVDFEVWGEALRYEVGPAGDLTLKGRADPRSVELDKMKLSFEGGSSGVAELAGSYAFNNRQMDLQYTASLAPALLSKYLDISWCQDELALEGQIQGQPDDLSVRGKLRCQSLDFPSLQPLSLKADYSFQGMGSGAFTLSVEQSRERMDLEVELARVAGQSIEGDINAFRFWSEGHDVMELSKPASFRLPSNGSIFAIFNELTISPLSLEGGDRKVYLAKEPETGLVFKLNQIGLAGFNPWLEKPLPELNLRQADVTLSALRPELVATMDLVVEEEISNFGQVRAKLTGLEAGSRLKLGSLELSLDDAVLVEASADLPLRLAWDEGEAGPKVKVDGQGDLGGSIRSLSSESTSRMIEEWTGLSVNSLSFDADVSGTWNHPEGHLRLKSSSIGFDGIEFGGQMPQPLPQVENLEVELAASGDSLQLKRLQAVIREGAVELAGEWPLPDGLGTGGIGSKALLERLKRGRFELKISGWKLENWTPYLPDMLRRSGRVSGSVRHLPGSGLEGQLSVEGLALRPTQNLPAIDSIGGEFQFDGWSLVLKDASARIGGSPVSVSGEVSWPDWPESKWLVEVSGTNVPVVRRPDIILRSDLNLTLQNRGGQGATELAGRLGLRSSTMLVEFDPLSPPVRSGPSATPPFFSVEEAPFNQWLLDLRIEGDRFLRVRSPYFQAVLSAGFDLSGSLGQPLLVGGVRIEEGHLSFPGAKLRLDSGEAYIEASEPDRLRLDVSGTARAGEYVITMEAGGTAAEPEVQFDASPPLPSASIIRLLSTGSASGGSAGTIGLYLGRGLLGAGGMGDNVGDRLTVDLGEETTRSGRETIGVQYEINNDVYLNGGYDVYDSYNTDLVWTIFEE